MTSAAERWPQNCRHGPLILLLVLAATPIAAGAVEQAEQVPTIPVALEAGPAPADPGSQPLETLIVTGSRIPRPDYETVSPMFVITGEDADRSGHGNAGELLQDLPFAGSAKNRTFNNGGNGQTELSLRGLDPSRVLILVDGHRWVGGLDPFNTRAIDLNTIPLGVIERIEVLKDGASAIYGADAIAGVVNIITRRHWSGLEVGTQWRAYEDGSNLEQQHRATFGSLSANTSFLVDLSHFSQADMSAAERPLTAVPRAGTGLTRGSGFTSWGHPFFIAEPQVSAALNAAHPDNCEDGLTGTGQVVPVCDLALRPGASIGSNEALATAANKYRPYESATHNFNHAPLNFLLTPLERSTAFARFGLRFADTALLNVTAMVSALRTQRQFAPTPLLFGDQSVRHRDVYIDRLNEFNPFDQDIGRYAGQGTANDPGAGIGSGLVLRRLMEAGPRTLTRENRIGLLRADVNDAWELLGSVFNVEGGVSAHRNARSQVYAGDVDMQRVGRALGPPDGCTGDCVPLNLFGAHGSVTPEMLDYIGITSSDRLETDTELAYGTLRTTIGDAGGLFGLQGAPAGLLLGVETRQDRFSEEPDPYIRSGASSLEGPREPTAGALYSDEAFAELSLPLLDERALEVMIAGRYTDHRVFAARTTSKLGVRYRALDNLLVRATWSEAYRAPSVTELYLGRGVTQTTVNDPCFGSNDPAVQQHCAAEGVPEGSGLLGPPAVAAFRGGNRRLQPELAESFTAGLAWSPGMLRDFTVYLDYFEFSLDRYIQFLTPEFVLDSCYGRPADAQRPQTCDLVERDDRGFISALDTLPVNLDEVRIEGVDLGFEALLPAGDWLPGRVVAQVLSQYLGRFDQYLPTANGGRTRIGNAGTSGLDTVYPRFNTRGSLIWLAGPWRASWTLRYIRGTVEKCSDDYAPSLRELGVCSHPDPVIADGDDSTNRLKDVLYHDIQLTHELAAWDAEVGFGVWNLLNTDPPVSYTAIANSYPATFYRPPDSRAPYLRFKMRFDPGSWLAD